MKNRTKDIPLEGLFAEYVANFEGGWKQSTKDKYDSDFRRLLDWLSETCRPVTTASLGFPTLVAFVGVLKARPAVRGVWRGDRSTVAAATQTSATTLSLNTITAYMRSIKSVVLWARDEGVISVNPFGRNHSRGKGTTGFLGAFARSSTDHAEEPRPRHEAGTGVAPDTARDGPAISSRRSS